MSVAAARLDGLVELGIQPKRSVRAARRRADALGVSGETLLLEADQIGLADVLAVARRDWLAGLATPGSDGAVSADLRDLLEATLSPAEAERMRQALARAARISSTVATTAAILVAAELAITLAWQEPLSYLAAERAQAGLERELDAKLDRGGEVAVPLAALAEARQEAARERRLAARAKLERESRAYGRTLDPGEAVGRLEIPAVGADFTVVEGASAQELTLGPGHLRETALPGQGRTTTVAGHRTTYGAPFGALEELSQGDVIHLELPYGEFTYKVERGLVVEPDDYWVTRDVGHERLVLTTCHPEYSAAERLVVFARLKR